MKNKLEFKNHGDCYSYIHYNKPDINVVLNNELKAASDISKKQLTMSGDNLKLYYNFNQSSDIDFKPYNHNICV